jgi:hypothetical protein
MKLTMNASCTGPSVFFQPEIKLDLPLPPALGFRCGQETGLRRERIDIVLPIARQVRLGANAREHVVLDRHEELRVAGAARLAAGA